MHLRRTALRSLCRTFHALGVTVGDPTTLLVLPSRSVRAARAFTDSELQQVRMAVMTRRCDVGVAACVVAFAEAGASTSELTELVWGDVHVGVPPTGRVGVAATVDATVAGNACGDVAVDLPGGGRLLARRVHLTQWGAGVVGQYQESAVWASESLVVSGSLFPPGSHSAQAAVTNRLRWLLRTAELHHVVGLGPRSFRLWGARHAYTQTGRIEAAAHVLGMRSLDATARAIGL
jgi:integrase/recombinase XerC